METLTRRGRARRTPSSKSRFHIRTKLCSARPIPARSPRCTESTECSTLAGLGAKRFARIRVKVEMSVGCLLI